MASIDPTRLRREPELTRMMRDAYYEVLNEDAEFKAALQHLHECFAGLRKPNDDDLGPAEETITHWEMASDAEQEAVKKHGLLVTAPDPIEARRNFRGRLLRTFGARWCLPNMQDLWHSLQLAAVGEPLRLETDTLVYWRAPFATTRVIVKDPDGAEKTIVKPWPSIQPFRPKRFRYDPAFTSGKELRQRANAIAGQVFRSIMEQGQEIDRIAKEQGWRPVPAKYQKTEERRRMAKRLYRRVICQLSWQQIADLESDEDPDVEPDAQSVRITVRDWARRLGIELPRLRTGRPKKP